MPNNIFLMETYRQLREDNLNDSIREAKVVADIYLKKDNK